MVQEEQELEREYREFVEAHIDDEQEDGLCDGSQVSRKDIEEDD